MITIACYNMKGGVGKTTTAVNLAHVAAQAGNRVILWDLDPQGAATFHLGGALVDKPKIKKLVKDKKKSLDSFAEATAYDNLALIPSGFGYRHLDQDLGKSKKGAKLLRNALESAADACDVFLLDCPPSFSVLSESVFHAAHCVLVPVVPAILPQQTFETVCAYIADNVSEPPAILAFWNMVDRRRSLHKTMVARSRANDAFLETTIPERSEIERMGVEAKPLPAYAPNSDTSLAYTTLWNEITTRLA